MSFQTPGLAPNRGAHRRVHSTVPMGASGGAFGGSQNPLGQYGNLGTLNLGLDGQPQGIPRGHGRRHSVNVVNKTGPGAIGGSISYGNPYGGDGFDDGFNPASFGGHSRQPSRVADSSWRISKFI